MTDQVAAYVPTIADQIELLFVKVLRETKHSLDAHMFCYTKNDDGTRSTNFDEAISISVVARTCYEACVEVENFVRDYALDPRNLRPKHQLCLRIVRKYMDDIHHNNIIIDHPQCDATKFGRGLVKFMNALHHCLKEVTPDADRSKYAREFLSYNQEMHKNDTRVKASTLH